jgi:hypothetical protein
MRLVFKRYVFGFVEKDIPVVLNIGTLEAVSKALGIEFWQIAAEMKRDAFEFGVQLLYQGYLTACKESFKKPKYTELHAVIWYEHMSKEATKEFMDMMTRLFGEITKTWARKKKVKKTIQPGGR